MKYLMAKGFSLVELAVVLLVMVILIVVVLPNYHDAILKMRRAEARSALHTVMLQQERFYTQHNTYSAFTPDTKNTLFKPWSGDSAESSYYHISASTCPEKLLTQCVLLTATPNTVYMDDLICGNLMLDSTYNKTYSKSSDPNPLCW